MLLLLLPPLWGARAHEGGKGVVCQVARLHRLLLGLHGWRRLVAHPTPTPCQLLLRHMLHVLACTPTPPQPTALIKQAQADKKTLHEQVSMNTIRLPEDYDKG